MADEFLLSVVDAENTSLPHRIAAFHEDSTPRWMCKFLDEVDIPNGTYQINKAISKGPIDRETDEYGNVSEGNIPYIKDPHVVKLYAVETILKIPSTVLDIYNIPHGQLTQQLKLTLEMIMEASEDLSFFHENYGLLPYCKEHDRMLDPESKNLPHILDTMMEHVWIKPSFFVMHQSSLRQLLFDCTSMGIYPSTIDVFGCSFISWRGIPILPSNKLDNGGKSYIFLMRTGEDVRGVVMLKNSSLTHNKIKSLSVKEKSTDSKGISSFHIAYYCNVAVLSPDAIICVEL